MSASLEPIVPTRIVGSKTFKNWMAPVYGIRLAFNDKWEFDRPGIKRLSEKIERILD